MVNPETRTEVAPEAIQKGYAVDSGTYVVVTREELAKTAPEPSRDIEITRCVPSAAVPEAWYARPYYLGPDGAPARTSRWRRHCADADRTAIARWVMRGKPYQGALRAHGDYLVLISLHHTGEVADVSELQAPRGREFDKRELQLAEQLISALAGEFDARAFHDEHRARVLALIDQKAEGKPVRKQRIKPLRRAEPGKLDHRARGQPRERSQGAQECLTQNRATNTTTPSNPTPQPRDGRSGPARSASAWSACR